MGCGALLQGASAVPWCCAGISPVLQSMLDSNWSPSATLCSDFVCVLAVPLSSPGNLRVSEEWYDRFRVTWDPPQSPTVGYRIVYQPIYGTCNTHTSNNCVSLSLNKYTFMYASTSTFALEHRLVLTIHQQHSS